MHMIHMMHMLQWCHVHIGLRTNLPAALGACGVCSKQVESSGSMLVARSEQHTRKLGKVTLRLVTWAPTRHLNRLRASTAHVA
jgi:hypothetical protein